MAGFYCYFTKGDVLMDIGKKLAALVLSSVLILNLSIPAITAAEKTSAENGIEVTGEAAQSAESFAEAQTADSGKEDLKAQFESLKNNSLHSLVEVFSEYPVLEEELMITTPQNTAINSKT
jgi:hypothetical protein